MIIKTSWCSYKDAKLKKVDKKYLKNVKIITDDDYRKREVGEIDLLKIPQDELIYVFNNMDKKNDFRYKHNYDKKNAKWSSDYYDLTDEMDDFDTQLESNLGLDVEKLFVLLKKYLNNADTKKYETFAKILNVTCELKYMDYDDYEYCDYNEHEHPSQKDVDHNYVGTYELVVMKPIPLEIIQNIKDTVEKLDKQVNQVKEVEKEM